MDEIRKEIMDIESKIITITGDNLNHLNHWAEDRAKREIVDGLLKKRCNLLNSMFLPTPENIRRFKKKKRRKISVGFGLWKWKR